ncbi:thermonuclease family protein [Rhizobiaceae bacterium n13]|uniref:Thermonuclease family protein n=1 Tax=Ferirhizobium litorale TaxID=2927786 RepID=A0AAE3U1P1_9HYPH|nr:thermonuclease family protein [Fererhizobium litorale]MDI7863064.1 thermonuclease family protein [Fererhizobium litorale]MDI7923259.1 thermonuclease family protein [Fererhizobium litorale]
MGNLGKIALQCLILLPSFTTSAEAGRRAVIDGPVTAEIIDVIDGDTLLVRAIPWPQHSIEVYVRLRGIDAPEIRSKCSAIRSADKDAKAALRQLTGVGATVSLSHISGEKYFGRVVADIRLDDGSDPVVDLLSEGHVRRYDGGRKPPSAC